MLDICPNCGDYDWNKTVENIGRMRCPKCGHQWSFKTMPLFILTGCSGVGKTTTAQELLQRNIDFLVLDSDFLFNLMPHETEEDYKNQAEQLMTLSKDLMQGGKPVLWTKAGALEHFEMAYNRRFFTKVYYLALVCNSKELERRMREGRHITDFRWISSSIEYNTWFMEKGIISDEKADTYDITGKSAAEVADYVISWVNQKLRNEGRKNTIYDK